MKKDSQVCLAAAESTKTGGTQADVSPSKKPRTHHVRLYLPTQLGPFQISPLRCRSLGLAQGAWL